MRSSSKRSVTSNHTRFTSIGSICFLFFQTSAPRLCRRLCYSQLFGSASQADSLLASFVGYCLAPLHLAKAGTKGRMEREQRHGRHRERKRPSFLHWFYLCQVLLSFEYSCVFWFKDKSRLIGPSFFTMKPQAPDTAGFRYQLQKDLRKVASAKEDPRRSLLPSNSARLLLAPHAKSSTFGPLELQAEIKCLAELKWSWRMLEVIGFSKLWKRLRRVQLILFGVLVTWLVISWYRVYFSFGPASRVLARLSLATQFFYHWGGAA